MKFKGRLLGTLVEKFYHSIMRLSYLILLLLLLVPSAYSEGLPELGEASQTDLSPLQERQLGESIMREIRADPSYYDDPPLNDYLNNLGYRLISSSRDPKTSLELFAIQDKEINAFSLPGGYIGVNTGLILLTQSESELASVLAHEMGHIMQHHIARMVGEQKWSIATSLATLAVAILAARSNSQASQAAMVGGQAAAAQSQLNFTREYELEADRIGFQTLNNAGLDVRAMPAFFERMQKAIRFVEGSAPSYLRTHPLTYERIADMENRAQSVPYRQVPVSQDFQFIRARLRAQEESPKDAITNFESSLQEKKYISEAAQHFGLAVALMRVKNYDRAEQELSQSRKMAQPDPLIELVAGQIKLGEGKIAETIAIYQAALKRYPEYRPLVYATSNVYLLNHQPEEALKLISDRLQYYPQDYHLYLLQAKSYADLDKKLLQHKSQAEAYYLLGNLRGAVEQLQIAQKSGDGDFYQLSAVEARLKELRSLEAEAKKQ
ncbi:MAG TPA: M48 family metalloprotease [Burkholderiales bacterium]|nr:M48 family metalloprotease [Burkholderiales bacterium]